MTDDRRLFYAEAQAAIRAGRLTPQERDMIARRHSRKAGYWGRHLRDLREWLSERGAPGEGGKE